MKKFEMKQDSKRDRIANTVISLDVSKGHYKWKISDLARSASVSRPLIYYHFGRSKKDILKNAFLCVAEEFYGFTKSRIEMVKSGKITESLLKTRQLYLKNPSLAVFYLRWRFSKSPLQKIMLALEDRYQEKLKILFPHISKAEIARWHSLFHGLVTSPFLSSDDVKSTVSFVTGK